MNLSRKILIGIGLLLAGTVLGDADLAITPAEYDFGTVALGNSSSQVIALKNVGDKVLRLDAIAFKADSDEDFRIAVPPYLPAWYGAGGTFYVEVVYTPTKSGKVNAVLVVNSSDPAEPEAEVTLEGESPLLEVAPEEQIAAIIEFYNASVADLTLIGTGPGKSAGGRLGAFGNMLEALQKQIAAEELIEAADKTECIYQKADGIDLPPDFVAGPAKEELAGMIEALLEALRK